MDGYSFLVLLCISAVPFLPVAVSRACPIKCNCYPSSTEGGGTPGYVVNCNHQSLTKIPTGLGSNTTELILNGNYIQKITTELQNLTNLKILRLDNNFIDSIDEGAFGRLAQLEELYLYKNCLHVLKNYTFHGLSSLRILNLYGNDMESFESITFHPLHNIVTINLSFNRLISIPNEAFKDLPRLSRLLLHNNELIVLGHEAFCNLNSLVYLNLDSNLLSTIPESSVCNLSSLSTLILSKNNIACDCDARWLLEWITDNRFTSPLCARPPFLSGQEITKFILPDICDPPTVKLTLNGSTLWTVGSNVTLRCPTTGVPAPDILWTRNEMSSRLSIIENQLIITNVNLSDAGDYQCIASSDAGIAVSNKITVYVIDLVMEMSDENREINQVLGERTELRCTTASELELNSNQVIWLKDDSLLTYSDRHVLLSNGSVLILNVTYDDAGSYVCRLEDMINISRTLTVRGPARIVSFPQEMCYGSELVLSLYSDVSYNLTCEATGNPIPDMVWFNVDREPVSNSSIQNENIITYELDSLSTQGGNRFTFICNVSNNLGGDERIINVFIKDRTTLAGNESVSLKVGDLIELPCNPPGRIGRPKWVREDGQELPSNSYVDSLGNLTIFMISLKDDGVYNCSIETASGTVILQYNVTVEGSPKLPSMCAIPTLVSLLGTNVSLHCPVSSNPPPLILWFVNGIPISNVSSTLPYMLNNSNMTLTLLTPPAERNSFTCQAFNSLGNDSSTVILNVESPPRFVKTPQNVRVNVSETAVFHCIGEGNPKPVLKWWTLRDGWEVEILPQKGRILISDEHLVLLNTLKSQAGEYYCTLNSSVGDEYISIASPIVHLTVWEFPKLIDGLPTELVAYQRHTIILPCGGVGDPRPAFAWYKDGTRVMTIPGQYYIDQHHGHLRIDDPMKNLDEGVYTCRVVNSAGSVYHDINLTIIRRPNITITPANITTIEGCTAFFRCLDNGDPPLNVTWFFDNQPLVSSPDTIIRPNGDLVLVNVSGSHTGLYTCQLAGVNGSNTFDNATLFVIEMERNITGPMQLSPIIRISSSQDLTLPPGADATFVCLSTGLPLPTTSWRNVNGNDTLSNSSRVFVTEELLIIYNVTPSDSGLYQCTSVNMLGQAMIVFSLTVSVPPSASISSDVNVTEGDTVKMNCRSIGIPTPSLTWRHNGSLVTVMERVSITIEESGEGDRGGVSSLLVITNVSLSEAGSYTCSANNTAGYSEYTQTVLVAPIIRPMQLSPIIRTNSSQDLTLPPGADATFVCLSTGLPLPTTSWRNVNENNMLSNSSRVFVTEELLIIYNVTPSDSGLYQCTSVNMLGQAMIVFSLTVSVPPSASISSDVNVTEGDTIKMNCRSIGIPTPSLTWRHNGSLVTVMERVSITIEESGEGDRGGVSSLLVITNVSLSEAGSYTCSANNTAGYSEYTQTVLVAPIIRPMQLPPIIRSFSSQELTLHPGANATFVCLSTGLPLPTTSWRNVNGNNMLSNSSRVFVTEELLIIYNVTPSDSGLYQCTSVNMLGQAMIVFSLTVSVPPSASISSDVNVTEGDTIKMNCRSIGIPTPSLTWRHNGSLVNVMERVSITIEESGEGDRGGVSSLLVITNVSLIEAGSYTCSANNTAGYSEYTQTVLVAPIIITSPPSIHSQLLPLIVRLGDPLSLNCTATARPPPLVQWTKDGVPVESENISIGLYTISESIIITRSSVSDGGSYLCTADNAVGTDSYSVQVNITTLPSFTTTPGPVSNLTGDNINISCIAIGLPTPSVKWVRLNRTDSTNTTVSNNGVLIINNSSLSDTGDYVCVATNIVGINTAQIPIEIKDPTEVPVLTTLPDCIPCCNREFLVPIGTQSDTTFDCQATGLPPPRYDWFINGTNVSEINPTRYTVLPNGTLVIMGVSSSDDGAYHCLASNIVGTSAVHFGASFTTIIAGTSEDMVVLTRSNIVLSCGAHNTSYWKYNGSVVIAGEVQRDDGSLEIHGVNSLHAGAYICVYNKTGRLLTHTIFLHVQERKEPPYFISLLNDTQVLAGRTLSLDCHVTGPTGHDIMISWYHNDIRLRETDEVFITDGNKTLILFGIGFMWSGNFSCSAENQYGTSTSAALVQVHARAPDEHVIVLHNSIVDLDCSEYINEEGEGGGGGIMEWRYNGEKLRSSEGYSTSSVLKLHDVSLSNQGDYTCLVAGIVKKLFFVEVVVPPFIVEATNKSVILNTSHKNLDCPYYGKPFPLLQWRHNSTLIDLSSKYSVFHNGTLVIYNINPHTDGGTYSCTAVNSYGSASLSYKVNIY